MNNKQIDFPDCWEEVLPAEWLYLLRLRQKLIERPKITLMDVKREWCRFVLSNRGIRRKSSIDYYILIDEFGVKVKKGKRLNLSFQAQRICYLNGNNIKVRFLMAVI